MSTDSYNFRPIVFGAEPLLTRFGTTKSVTVVESYVSICNNTFIFLATNGNFLALEKREKS